MRRLVDTETAAHAVSRSLVTIRWWIHRGYLIRYDGLIDLDELWVCERRRHQQDRRLDSAGQRGQT